jgi:hypothetical protein
MADDTKLNMVSYGLAVNSPMATAMGASIKVTAPGRGMYLISGAGASLELVAKQVGCHVVLRLGAGKILATLPFAGYLALRNSRLITHIGPVSVDMQRLSRIVELIANSNGSKNGATI